MCKLYDRNMKNSFLPGLLFFLFVGCEKNNTEKIPVAGTWIEAIHKTDTIVFDDQYPSFKLNRGTEIRNGYLLPKYLSGPYFYEIEKDSIYLRWLLSSSSYGKNYYFNLDSKNGQIKIGNFFVDSLNQNATLTFSRIQ